MKAFEGAKHTQGHKEDQLESSWSERKESKGILLHETGVSTCSKRLPVL